MKLIEMLAKEYPTQVVAVMFADEEPCQLVEDAGLNAELCAGFSCYGCKERVRRKLLEEVE